MRDQYLFPNASFLRLYNEYKKYGKLFISYDFDHTVYDYDNHGESYYEIIRLIRDMKSIGFHLNVWTDHSDIEYVQKYLNARKIPFDTINADPPIGFISSTRKVYYSALLDDRAGLIQVYQELTLLVELIKIENHG